MKLVKSSFFDLLVRNTRRRPDTLFSPRQQPLSCARPLNRPDTRSPRKKFSFATPRPVTAINSAIARFWRTKKGRPYEDPPGREHDGAGQFELETETMTTVDTLRDGASGESKYPLHFTRCFLINM